jgi:predicted dehydrogenase
MPLRLGIVGRRGTAFIDGIRATDGVELAAICDLDPETVRKQMAEHSIPKGFEDFDAMLDSVDAVVVATPMQLHAEQSVRAMEAGKHVLSEVTACVSLEECWSLVEAVRRTGCTYMMSENYCYFKENVLVREMARKGLFGELYYGEGEYLHDVKSMHHNPDGTPTWRSHWQVGQNGNTYPTHSFGPVMQWFWTLDPGDGPESVVCMGTGRHTDPEHPHDDTSITLVQMRSGKLIRLRLDMMSNRPHQIAYYSLQGTHGVYEASRVAGQPGNVWIGENPGPGPVQDNHREWRPLTEFEEHLPDEWKNPTETARNAGHGGGDYFVVRDFVEALRGLRPNPIDVYAAAEWTAVGLCSQLSIAQHGAPVRLPEFRR